MKLAERADNPKPWYVVQTAPRAEADAAADLTRRGFEVYIPRAKVDREHARRHVIVERHYALFPRYLFARPFPPYLTLRMCKGAQYVLGTNLVPSPIPAGDVAAILEAQLAGEFDDTRAVRNDRLRKAGRVRIVDGPLMGWTGTITDVDLRGRVHAMVRMLGGLQPVVFERAQVEACA